MVCSFVKTVVSDLIALHEGIQPLSTFHIGGDEVANAWTNSSKCEKVFQSDGFPAK